MEPLETKHEPRHEKTNNVVLFRSYTNQAVQTLEKTRGLELESRGIVLSVERKQRH